MKNKRCQINIVLNEEENRIVNSLRDEYAINISGCFKVLLKNYWKQLKNKDIKIEANKI